MYIHVGGGMTVRERDIIGIFDLDGKITTEDTAHFLRQRERGGLTTLATPDLPKSFLVVREGGAERVIFSPLSVAALKNRIY